MNPELPVFIRVAAVNMMGEGDGGRVGRVPNLLLIYYLFLLLTPAAAGEGDSSHVSSRVGIPALLDASVSFCAPTGADTLF